LRIAWAFISNSIQIWFSIVEFEHKILVFIVYKLLSPNMIPLVEMKFTG